MLHFEFGQDRLAEPHPLYTFELAQGAIKGALVPFCRDLDATRTVSTAALLDGSSRASADLHPPFPILPCSSLSAPI